MFQNTSILFLKKNYSSKSPFTKEKWTFYAEIIKVWNAKIARLGRR